MNFAPQTPSHISPISAKQIGIGALGILGALSVLAAAAIWASPSALANDKYFSATRKDCSACHVNVTNNYRLLTRYGTAFLNNRCPGVRGGC